MNLIKSSVEFLGETPTDYEGNIALIEKAGRTCYKSESKGKPEAFVKKLVDSRHLAMPEHSNFVVRGSLFSDTPFDRVVDKIKADLHGTYLKVVVKVLVDGAAVYIGGNLTAWYYALNSWGPANVPVWGQPFLETYGDLFAWPPLNDLAPSAETHSWEQCGKREIPKALRRYTFKFICDRGVSHELVRHRPCSFAQESTRYVNYGKRGATFIEPSGFHRWSFCNRAVFKAGCWISYKLYNLLLSLGRSPQQARALLPNALKTEVVVTADWKEWEHIFNLRCAMSAHPDIRRVAFMAKTQLSNYCGGNV